MISSNALKQACSSSTNCCGLIFSPAFVKSTKSVNMTVTLSKYFAAAVPFSFNSSATSLGNIFNSRSSDLFFSVERSLFVFRCVFEFLSTISTTSDNNAIPANKNTCSFCFLATARCASFMSLSLRSRSCWCSACFIRKSFCEE